MPLGAYPYLWMSAEIDVTPGTRKSKTGTWAAASGQKGRTQPPTHASTWTGTPRALAAAATSSTGSTTPCG
ncbi:hypothetical protein D3C74_487040 [compost metagenome]